MQIKDKIKMLDKEQLENIILRLGETRIDTGNNIIKNSVKIQVNKEYRKSLPIELRGE